MDSLAGDFIFWLCVLLSTTYLLHFLSRRTGNLPPGPVGLPVIGSLLQFGGGLPHEAFARLSRQYGPVMTVWMGFRPTVVVSSVDMAEEVMQRQGQVFSGRSVPDACTALDHDKYSIALGQVGPKWQELRRFCNSELFTPRRLDALKGLREEKVRVLLQHVRKACTDGRAIDIGAFAFATTLNLTARTLFSQDLVGVGSESVGDFKTLVCKLLETTASPNLSDFFPALKWIDPQGLRKQNKIYVQRIYNLFNELIDKHIAAYEVAAAKGEAKKNEDFVDAVLELTRNPNSGFTRENILPFLLDLFLAGTETSATTVEWAMTELLRHPNKLAAARSELKRTVGEGNIVKESDIMHLPYLEAIMKETLRMHLPVPLLLPRRADATTKLAGYTIPKHMQVIINVSVFSKDPKLWDKPECFMPERFLESDVNFKGTNFQFIPFGAGRRICPGIPLAHRMVLLLLGSLINSFSWVLPNQMAPEDLDVTAKFRMVQQKANPLKVIPAPLMDM
ncbi:unnamed protein product [Victoria cruziana]